MDGLPGSPAMDQRGQTGLIIGGWPRQASEKYFKRGRCAQHRARVGGVTALGGGRQLKARLRAVYHKRRQQEKRAAVRMLSFGTCLATLSGQGDSVRPEADEVAAGLVVGSPDAGRDLPASPSVVVRIPAG